VQSMMPNSGVGLFHNQIGSGRTSSWHLNICSHSPIQARVLHRHAHACSITPRSSCLPHQDSANQNSVNTGLGKMSKLWQIYCHKKISDYSCNRNVEVSVAIQMIPSFIFICWNYNWIFTILAKHIMFVNRLLLSLPTWT
jgi:hypothetical protein